MKQFNLDEYFAHPNREVMTRDGRKARIICTNKKPAEYPIVALVEDAESTETEYCFNKEGKLVENKDHQLDLSLFPKSMKDGLIFTETFLMALMESYSIPKKRPSEE